MVHALASTASYRMNNAENYNATKGNYDEDATKGKLAALLGFLCGLGELKLKVQ